MQAAAIVTGAPSGPVLDKGQPFDTDGGRLPSTIAPNMQFRIHGQNLLNPDGSAPNVLIGGRAMQVDSASATNSQLLVLTPPDLAVNVEMQVVIRRTDSASVPEAVVVAPSWPVVAMAGVTENEAIVTGLGDALPESLAGEGIRILTIEPAGAGLWRVLSDRSLRGVRLQVGHSRVQR